MGAVYHPVCEQETGQRNVIHDDTAFGPDFLWITLANRNSEID
ncbi:MAG: hypothetical protein ACI92Z_002900 [Paracoccaceae bacterium]|jgi:hypothetical protein